jgi:type III secretory pathway component EscR
MQRRNLLLSGLFLTAALAVSGPIVAAAQEAHVQVRVYDSYHRDYHNWDDREDRAYRGYLTGRHETYREYNSQNHRTQRQYWKWRHEHPDHD